MPVNTPRKVAKAVCKTVVDVKIIKDCSDTVSTTSNLTPLMLLEEIPRLDPPLLLPTMALCLLGPDIQAGLL